MRLSEKQASDLIDILKALPDPRCKRGVRHRNLSIIALSICAVVCGCRGYAAIAQWTKNCSQKCWGAFGAKKMDMSISLPANLLSGGNCRGSMPKRLIRLSLLGWSALFWKRHRIDGKTLRGARREDGTKFISCLHLSTSRCNNRPKRSSLKSNEIPQQFPVEATEP